MAHPGRSTGAPCPLWTPRRPTFHPAVSLHTIKPWTRHSRGAKVWHLPHNYLPWRSKPGHTMEIQAGSHIGDPSRFTQWRSKAGSHNGDPKPVHTMEIQAGSHNGDPKPVHTMEIQAGSHNGDPKPVHTMEIQSRFTQWRSKAGSHNGDPSRFTQWRSKAGSHNGDPKPVHTAKRGTSNTESGSGALSFHSSKSTRGSPNGSSAVCPSCCHVASLESTSTNIGCFFNKSPTFRTAFSTIVRSSQLFLAVFPVTFPGRRLSIALAVLVPRNSGYFAYTLAIMQAESQRVASSRSVQFRSVQMVRTTRNSPSWRWLPGRTMYICCGIPDVHQVLASMNATSQFLTDRPLFTAVTIGPDTQSLEA